MGGRFLVTRLVQTEPIDGANCTRGRGISAKPYVIGRGHRNTSESRCPSSHESTSEKDFGYEPLAGALTM